MVKCLFLDIDDTLIHKEYCSHCIRIYGEDYFIHKITQHILKDIKKIIPIILISGRRKSSYFRVKEFIPHNIAILEHGGFIYNDDLIFSKWKQKLIPVCYQKGGYLWNIANELRNKGFYIDRKGRKASFRVQLEEFKRILPRNLEKEVLKSLPDYLRIVKNKEMVDIISANSGKLNAASFYLKEKKLDISDVAFIGNDENDIDLLSAVGRAITFRDAPRNVILSVIAEGKQGLIVDSGHKGIIKALKKIKEELI